MENFFGLIKTEMFYGQEKDYTSIEELIQAMHEYIRYFNNDRIKVRLKGLTPMGYRNQALRINQNLNRPTFGGQFILNLCTAQVFFMLFTFFSALSHGSLTFRRQNDNRQKRRWCS